MSLTVTADSSKQEPSAEKDEPIKSPLTVNANISDILLRFASPNDKVILAAGLFGAAAAGVGVPLSTIIFGEMTNALGAGAADMQASINQNCLYFTYLGLSLILLTYIYTACFAYYAENCSYRLRIAYFEAVLRQDIAFFDKEGGGSVSTRLLSDTQLFQDGIGEKVALLVMNIAMFIAGYVIAFSKSWRLTLVLICSIPAMLVSTAYFRPFIIRYAQGALANYAIAGNVAEEALQAVRTLIAFSATDKLAKRYHSLLDKAEKEGIKRQAMIGLVFGLFTFIMYSMYSLAFYYGGILLQDNLISAGEIVTCFFSVLIGSFGIAGMSGQVQSMLMALGAGSALLDTIDRVPAIDSFSQAGERLEQLRGQISVREVSFRYPARPEQLAVEKLSLEIEPGHTVALVGQSGSGKSTLIQLIERFYDPESGSIQLDGVELRELNLAWLRRQIGYVTQEPTLFRGSIFQNVAHGLVGTAMESLPADEKRRLVEEACRQANAHDFITGLPVGYETQIGERGLLLSGGQKQRIAIARAIVKNPRILLLDEATSALDTQSEKIVQQALERASAGRTTVVVAHRLSTIRNADKIVVMNQGRVVEAGTHSLLMTKADGSYRKMVELQKIDVGKAKESADQPAVQLDHPDKLPSHATGGDDAAQVAVGEQSNHIELKQVNVDGKYSGSAVNRFEKSSAYAIFLCVTRLNLPEWKYMAGGLIFALVSGLTMPLFALMFGDVFQIFYSTGDKLRNDVNFYSLMFFIIAFCGFIANLLKFVMFGISGEKLTTRIRDQSFRSMLRQEVGWFDEDKNSVGQLTTSLSSNAQQLQNLSGTVVGSILELCASIIGSAVVSIVVGWKLGLVVVFSCMPLNILASKIRLDLVRKGNQATKECHEKSSQEACEAVGAMRTVASLTRERELVQRFQADLQTPLAIGRHHALFGSILYALSQGFSNLNNALAFWYGGQLFITDGYNIKQMLTVLMASVFVGQSAGIVFSMMPDLGRSIMYARDTLALLERRPKIDSNETAGKQIDRSSVQGSIEFKSVQFSYPSRPTIPILHGLSLKVQPGQQVALVGASGCGKSTCIALIQRLYDPTGGSLTIDGQPIESLNLQSLRKSMTIVSQEPSLFNMSIRDNIRLGIADNDSTVSNADIELAAREANIHEFIAQLPQGYDTNVGGKGSQLSGGQKQRIAIARALLLKPKILLLDEATSALDGQSEKAVQDTLDQAAKGRTTVSIAHRLSTIKGADQIYVFQAGRIVEYGCHEDLVSREGGLYRMLAAQQDLNS